MSRRTGGEPDDSTTFAAAGGIFSPPDRLVCGDRDDPRDTRWCDGSRVEVLGVSDPWAALEGLGDLHRVMDLVTRDEFEVQEAVLARTREKLERLEARLEEIKKS